MTPIDFIFVVLFSLFGLLSILSVPSFVEIYKLGYKDYFRNLRLFYMLKNVDTCYSVTSTLSQRYKYPDGTIRNHTSVVTNYYFPYFINDKKVYVIGYNVDSEYSNIRVNDATYDGNEWSTELIDIKTHTCLISQLLNDRLKVRLKTISKNAIKLDDINDLNGLVNSQVKSIRREGKLNQILS